MDLIAIVFVLFVGWFGGSEYRETTKKAECENFKAVELHKEIYSCKKDGRR